MPGPSVASPPRIPLGSPGSPEWHNWQFSGPHAIWLLWHAPQNFPLMISAMSTSLAPARILKPTSVWHTMQLKRMRWNQCGNITGRMPAFSARLLSITSPNSARAGNGASNVSKIVALAIPVMYRPRSCRQRVKIRCSISMCLSMCLGGYCYG